MAGVDSQPQLAGSLIRCGLFAPVELDYRAPGATRYRVASLVLAVYPTVPVETKAIAVVVSQLTLTLPDPYPPACPIAPASALMITLYFQFLQKRTTLHNIAPR